MVTFEGVDRFEVVKVVRTAACCLEELGMFVFAVEEKRAGRLSSGKVLVGAEARVG
jgi:hypothetical protein